MGFPRDENATLVQVETGDDRRRGSRNIGTQPGKKIAPLITRKTHVGANVGRAYSRLEGVGNFPNNVCMCVRIEGAVPLLDGRDFLESRAAVREDN